jgi:hypothetical protein
MQKYRVNKLATRSSVGLQHSRRGTRLQLSWICRMMNGNL